MNMNLRKRALAEFIGTFWLLFGGCGSAVLAAAFPALGIGFIGVALALWCATTMALLGGTLIGGTIGGGIYRLFTEVAPSRTTAGNVSERLRAA
jgi:hypothetical protein